MDNVAREKWTRRPSWQPPARQRHDREEPPALWVVRTDSPTLAIETVLASGCRACLTPPFSRL
jgi:hypothetical protein